MTERRHELLILGIGNLLLGDEGVGVHAVQQLERMELPPEIACMDGGTGGFHLLEAMQQAERLVIIDAAAADDAPGSIARLRPRYASDYPPTLTAHDIGLKDLLSAFHLLGDNPDVRLIAITIDPHQDLGMELSPVIQQAAEQAVAMVLEEVDEFCGKQFA
ncbi:MAG: hydrogenase maturation protease [Acidobacteriota bacterium]|nr:hydrogenase maturation protease [Acidobacteriota bacterium]